MPIERTKAYINSQQSARILYLCNREDYGEDVADALTGVYYQGGVLLQTIDCSNLNYTPVTFLYTIVAQVHDIVNRRYALRNWNEAIDIPFRAWEASFLKLSNALGSGYMRPGTEDYCLDSEFIMEQNLRYTTALNNLEKDFQEFIERSLSLLQGEARKFIVLVLNSESNPEIARSSLEAIRMYLRSANICVVNIVHTQIYRAVLNAAYGMPGIAESKLANAFNYIVQGR